MNNRITLIQGHFCLSFPVFISYLFFLSLWLKISSTMNGTGAFSCSFNNNASNFSSFSMIFAVDFWHMLLWNQIPNKKLMTFWKSMIWEEFVYNHCSWFCTCKFAYLLKFTCYHKISACGAFAVIHSHEKSGKISVTDMHLHSWGWTRWHSVKRQLSYRTHYPLHRLLSDTLFVFLCFCWWFCCLKSPPSIAWSAV